jgi:hypothetical protein
MQPDLVEIVILTDSSTIAICKCLNGRNRKFNIKYSCLLPHLSVLQMHSSPLFLHSRLLPRPQLLPQYFAAGWRVESGRSSHSPLLPYLARKKRKKGYYQASEPPAAQAAAMEHGVSCARTSDDHDYFRAAQVGDLDALGALLAADPSSLAAPRSTTASPHSTSPPRMAASRCRPDLGAARKDLPGWSSPMKSPTAQGCRAVAAGGDDGSGGVAPWRWPQQGMSRPWKLRRRWLSRLWRRRRCGWRHRGGLSGAAGLCVSAPYTRFV